ncbi:SDR family oxidoreductase [Vibrio tapetis subsp. quintayensis]|uniref:SDR family oxidoreductase n=1 Tax=Vibrio tapetis TaxID=52443 RepID=UPI0025B5B468|nr:SDR family oxidoreductase [Vibrio tapetis]MDN3680505.1 SDR family oxidoreductase [Vibrio tapetis subsp. quintayensis]
MDIRNSVILVTSAGTALGCTLATHFLKLGAEVIVADTDSALLLETIKRCRKIVNDVDYYHLPDNTPLSIEALFDHIDDHFTDGIDVLINHWPSQPLPSLIDETHTNQDFAESLTVVVSSLYGYGQVTARRMRQHNTKGVIVNLTSNQTQNMDDSMNNMSAMLTGLTQSWAKELDQFNIRVGAVVPSHQRISRCEHGKWARVQDELIRNTEYIVANDYFNGRVMAAEA